MLIHTIIILVEKKAIISNRFESYLYKTHHIANVQLKVLYIEVHKYRFKYRLSKQISYLISYFFSFFKPIEYVKKIGLNSEYFNFISHSNPSLVFSNFRIAPRVATCLVVSWIDDDTC